VKSKAKQNLSLLLFVAPALIVYLLFKLIPAISGMFYAMTDWNGFYQDFQFVGFANFGEIFTDKPFWHSVWFTLKFVVVNLLLSNGAALALAYYIESIRKGKSFFRTAYYLPNMISGIISGYMWMFIFTKVLYYFADNWGWAFLDHSWIGDPNYSFIAIVIVSAWNSCGYLMIIYIAALQGVSPQYIEAAQLDGGNGWQIFWKVVFPMIRHALTICIFWSLNNGFQMFDTVYTLTGGGPGRATQTVALNIFEEAFQGNIRYGYATAKSTVLFLIVFSITLLQLRFMKMQEEEL